MINFDKSKEFFSYKLFPKGYDFYNANKFYMKQFQRLVCCKYLNASEFLINFKKRRNMEKYNIVRQKIYIYQDYEVVVDLNNPVHRFIGNPVLTAHDVNKVWINPALQVKTVHNAGIAEYKNEIVMLFRSHLRNGISILGIARSKDGLNNWRVESMPAMLPASPKDNFADGVNEQAIIENEAGGIEDPRISKLEDTYAITYSAYHAKIKDSVRVSLATTKNFKNFTRWGPVLDKDMRNVVIFPEKIAGQYVGLFRPNDDTNGDVGGIFKQIKIGYTDNWQKNSWNILEKPIIKSSSGPGAISDKIGPGATPLKTKYGWLNIFHGVRSTMDGNPYVLTVALHELKKPASVKVSNIPILFPSKADCLVQDSDYVHVPNVVFTCGAIRQENGTIFIYYGGNDTVMNVGITHEDVLVEFCENYGQDPLTGQPLYKLRSKS